MTTTYTSTGRTVEAEELAIGDLIRTSFMDRDGDGVWREYTEIARVTALGEREDKYMPGLRWLVVHTNHPTAKVGRTVYADETRPWDDFELVSEAV